MKSKSDPKSKKAVYEGWALVNKPSNQFFILFRADKEEVESIKGKMIPIVGKFKVIKEEFQNYDQTRPII